MSIVFFQRSSACLSKRTAESGTDSARLDDLMPPVLAWPQGTASSCPLSLILLPPSHTWSPKSQLLPLLIFLPLSLSPVLLYSTTPGGSSFSCPFKAPVAVLLPQG